MLANPMPLDRALEVVRLNQADTHIADSERRVTEQRVRLGQLRADGRATLEAERLLTNLEQMLERLHGHRDEIVRTIAQIDAGLA